MRKCMMLSVLAICGLLAAPLAAQSTPGYTAPSASELDQLKQLRNPELADVRAGDLKQPVLSDTEREQIEQMLAGQVVEARMLYKVRAGEHFHVHWGVWVAIPSACGTVLLIVLLILLLA